MDYALFKAVHYLSIGGMVFTLAGIALNKKSFLAFMGFWILALATSFGLVSALGLHENFPQWANTKFYLWIVMGVLAIAMKFKPKLQQFASSVISLLLVIITFLAVYKP